MIRSQARSFALTALELLAQLLGQRVEPPGGEAHVPPGDRERRHELQQPEDQADGDVAPQLRRHEGGRVGGAQHVEQVPRQEQPGDREDERTQAVAEVLELRGRLDGFPVADVRRWWCRVGRAQDGCLLALGVQGHSQGGADTPRKWPATHRPTARPAADERSCPSTNGYVVASSRCSRRVAAAAHAGGRPRSDTTTITANASGTVHSAGWPSRLAARPSGAPRNRSTPIAPTDASRPTTTPATAPAAVSRGHQMPSTSKGQNVAAATAKPAVTSTPTSMLTAGSASATITTAPASGASRSRRRPAPGSRSCATALESASSRPSEVARNAANAPAESIAVTATPTGPASTRC